jgi:hypothetical protein
MRTKVTAFVTGVILSKVMSKWRGFDYPSKIDLSISQSKRFRTLDKKDLMCGPKNINLDDRSKVENIRFLAYTQAWKGPFRKCSGCKNRMKAD